MAKLKKSYILLFALFAGSIYSQPVDPHVALGEASFHQQGNLLQIKTSDRAVINWKEFSIQKGEIAKFVQPSETAKVLNRVMGGKESQILGMLQANGGVYLINPSGILIGKDAVINTASILFSTLDTSDKEFMEGIELLFVGDSSARIYNQGQITANNGDVILIAACIANEGEINAPNGHAGLGAASEVLLRPLGEERIYIRPEATSEGMENTGSIQAMQAELKASGNPYAFAIKHTGKTKVQGISAKDGRIYLVANAGKVSVGGQLEAQKGAQLGGNIALLGNEVAIESDAIINAAGNLGGGEILIGGDLQGSNPNIQNASRSSISFGSQCKADALSNGNGGKVIVWSEKNTSFAGSITAQGGPNGGDGGFVEISGKAEFDYRPTFINTSAPHGKSGTLLLDPSDITIQATLPTTGGFTNPYTGAGAASANLLISDLVGAAGLLNNDVTVLTGPGGGTGDIIVQDSFSWGSSHTLTLTASNNLNVKAIMQATGGGGLIITASNDVIVGTAASTVPCAILTNTGNISFTITNNLNVVAGANNTATAIIHSDAGSIHFVNVGGNVTIGDPANNSQTLSEISSRAGNITFDNIGGNLDLTGGTATNAYAQIGIGKITVPTLVNSSIEFKNNVGAINLTAGSGTGSYVQIGHSPFGAIPNITAAGNIIFDSGAGSTLTLTGNGDNATAIIGHGNELTDNLSVVSGNISASALTGVTLQGGNSTGSHAIIGFHNPKGGSAVSFQVTSSSVEVDDFAAGSITLNAGNQSNAVIGYYNQTMLGAGPVVTINDVIVTSPINVNTFVNAGNNAGSGFGVAAIGTLANHGTAQSKIDITTGSLTINGPMVVGDGVARVVNNLPGVSAPFDVNITANGVGDLKVLGGTTTANAFADIYSSQDLHLEFHGLTLNNLAQLSPATIAAYGNIIMNKTTQSTFITLTGGGVNATATALMQSLHGAVTCGTTGFFGGTALTIGNSNSQSSSKIIADSGNTLFNLLGNTILNGGTGAGMATAQLESNTGTIQILGVNMNINGGSDNLCYAEIASLGGNITLNLTGTLNLQGGTGTEAYAQIGKGYVGSATDPINSSILITRLDNGLILQGGDGTGAYAQIGHSPFGGSVGINVTGNIDFNPTPIGPTSLTGGTGALSTNATAIIGHGNELSTQLRTCIGDIKNFNVLGNVTITTGIVPQTHAIIGYHNKIGGSNFTCMPQNGISLDSISGNITLTAKNGSNATIGYYNANAGSLTTVSVPHINVQTTTSKAIFLQAGNDNGTKAGVAVIGTLAGLSSTAQSNISVIGGTVTLNGPQGTDNGLARVVNNTPNQSAPFDISFQVTNLILLGGPAVPVGNPFGFADVYSSRNITTNFTGTHSLNSLTQTGYAQVLANNNITIIDGNTLSLTGGSIFNAYALIRSLNGNVQLGNLGFGDVVDVLIGDASSFATSAIQTGSGLNTINCTRNMFIQGGQGANTTALIVTDSGAFQASANTMTITGGSGTNASAEIRSNSGSGEIETAGNLTLQGGTNTLCFAQIATTMGTIEFTSIGGDINLIGGPAAGNMAYAQIGKGSVTTETNINSDLTFTEVVGGVSLQGGGGTSNYAQIGHSPFTGTGPIMVNGDITFDIIEGNAGGLTGLALQGGTALNTTAIIGHGNELTGNLGNTSGDFSINVTGIGGVSLNTGTALLETSATIGFYSPAAGPAANNTFTVNSNLVSVQTTQGPIQFNNLAQFGDRNNAVIGYYNATTPALMTPGVIVTINNVSVASSLMSGPNNFITLQAGNDAGTSTGVAAIGTFVAAGNTAVSSVNVAGDTLNILGPTGAFDGAALILNNTPGTPHPLNIFINTNNFNMRGGTGSPAGFAEVYSSGALRLDFTTSMTVGIDPLAPLVLQNGDSLIDAFGDVNINNFAASSGVFTMVGGALPTVRTQINSMVGAINIGNVSNYYTGASTMTIGRADMIGSARIFTTTGNISVLVNDITIQGGLNAAALAEIEAHSSATVFTLGAIDLTGGSVAGALARIGASFNNLTITSLKDITLTGGVAGAELRNFGFANGSNLISSATNITMNANSRILNAGNGLQTISAINNITMNGNSIMQANGGVFTTFAGVSTFLNDTSQIFSNGGPLAIVVDNDFPKAPGIGPGMFVLGIGAQVNGTQVRIFTAKRTQNSVLGTINGMPFIPGPIFVDSATEQWGTYYFSSFGGTPFTIFYKDFVPGVEPDIYKNGIVSVEFLQDLKAFDDLIMFAHWMGVSFDQAAYKAKRGFHTLIDLVPDRKYLFFRRLYRNYNMKKIDTLN